MDGKQNQIVRCIEIMQKAFDHSARQIEQAYTNYVDTIDRGITVIKFEDFMESLIETNEQDYQNLVEARRMLVKWMKEQP